MHELAVCQALMTQVERVATEHRAQRVEQVQVAIGPLSGVEPRLLQQAFLIARAGSIADNAALVIDSLPVQVECRECGERTEVLPSRLLCGNCGDWRTTLVSGDELYLQHVELVRDTTEDDAAADRQARHGNVVAGQNG